MERCGQFNVLVGIGLTAGWDGKERPGVLPLWNFLTRLREFCPALGLKKHLRVPFCAGLGFILCYFGRRVLDIRLKRSIQRRVFPPTPESASLSISGIPSRLSARRRTLTGSWSNSTCAARRRLQSIRQHTTASLCQFKIERQESGRRTHTRVSPASRKEPNLSAEGDKTPGIFPDNPGWLEMICNSSK